MATGTTITERLTTLIAAKTAIITALNAKGYNIDSAVKLEELASLIDATDSIIEPYLVAWTRESSAITNLVIPNGITQLGSRVFAENGFINSVRFPEGLKEIGSYAFYMAYNLSVVLFPSTLETISNNAFDSCVLRNIDIPEKVKRIDINAFAYCQSCTGITIRSPNLTIGTDAFLNCSRDVTFTQRTMAQVKGMQSYNSWGILTSTPIHCTDGTFYYNE